MMDLVMDTDLSGEQREHLGIARSSAYALLQLLNEILDFSKIEAGKMELYPVLFPVRQCVEEAVRTFLVQAMEKGLELSCTIDPAVPEAAVGDPVRLRQVLVNLVGNAVKFTDAGRVQVLIGLDSATESEIVLHAQVADTGIGISADKQRVIFDPFRQADGSTTRRHGGTGLGLTITARLLELMGGSICVESECGKGTIFHFCVTLKPVPPGIEVDSPEEPAGRTGAVRPDHHARILVAEDNAVNQKLIAELLRRRGHEVVIVGNGVQAVDAAASQRFDLILMDVHMPEMDGLEASRIIRLAEQATRAHVPIVALTAGALKSDQEQCFQAGMDGYLCKPIDVRSLCGLLDKLTCTPSNV
jgi:CheY-like chemotaxis protein